MTFALNGPALWYATRATGLVTLLLLTASMLLGPSNMDTALGWQDALDRVHARLSPVASGKEPTHG